jgi:hypothetical protein
MQQQQQGRPRGRPERSLAAELSAQGRSIAMPDESVLPVSGGLIDLPTPAAEMQPLASSASDPTHGIKVVVPADDGDPLLRPRDRDPQRRLMPTKSLPALRSIVQLRDDHRFDVSELEPDLLRVFGHLKGCFGEEYALHVIFTVRTAVELHRAWHMTLLTSKLLNHLKERFNLRMTWSVQLARLPSTSVWYQVLTLVSRSHDWRYGRAGTSEFSS